MTWTKRDYIVQAYDAIGVSSYIFDLPTEALQSALRQLDAMMGTWYGMGIKLGWPMNATPGNADLDQEVGVPGYANEAIYLNLGIRLAPMHGKELAPATIINARAAYEVVLSRMAMPQELQMPANLPRGAGQKVLDSSPFVTPPDTDPLKVGDNGQLILGN